MRVCSTLAGGLMAIHFVAAAATTPTPTPAPATPTSPSTPLSAVWKERHIDFVYLGRTARYTCDGLSDKVRAMLLDLGARRDLRVAAIGCANDGHQPLESMQPSLDVVFSAPALPDSMAMPAHAGDLAATEAHFEVFTITSDAFRNMGVGDCELVEEFARQILPKLATRSVKQDIACVPNQLNGSRFLVHGEVLKVAPLRGP